MCWSKNAICSCAVSIGVLAVASPIARSRLDETLVRAMSISLRLTATVPSLAALNESSMLSNALSSTCRACFCTGSVAASMASSRRGAPVAAAMVRFGCCLKLPALPPCDLSLGDLFALRFGTSIHVASPCSRKRDACPPLRPTSPAIGAQSAPTSKSQRGHGHFGAAQAKTSARQSFATWATASARYFR